MLLEFACGSLPAAESLMISTHTSLNNKAREEFLFLEDIGGTLMETLEPAMLSDKCLHKVLDAIDNIAPEEKYLTESQCKNALPPALARIVDCATLSDLKWSPLVKGVDVIDLHLDGSSAKLRLMRCAPGYITPKHSHDEFEMTLVLDGAYSDELGQYARGDLSIVEEDEGEHQPKACVEHGCICLTSTFAPLKFTSPWHRLINYFMKF